MASGTNSQVDNGIDIIDLDFLGVDGVIASYLIDCGDQLAVVETGPTSTLPALAAGIERRGASWDDVSTIVVTHIHLDHSGAAGVIVRDHPHIRVLVHPVGAPHLVAPERLVRSAARIYGDDMARLWGEIDGMPEERVRTVTDGERISIGNRSFRFAHTLGHATHHMVILDERSGTLFTGDTGGVRVPGSDYVAAPIPPPEFDPDGWRASLAIMRDLAPSRLALTHFGIQGDVERHLGEIEPRLNELVALGEESGDTISDLDEMTR
ncbi:MAG TPA: MBL fold metallo-hydrolase, partial [Thermomicrobiales bacterium]|nr:MBL fold metallo-hydrolase [Thermomicrobiales bacterium]